MNYSIYISRKLWRIQFLPHHYIFPSRKRFAIFLVLSRSYLPREYCRRAGYSPVLSAVHSQPLGTFLNQTLTLSWDLHELTWCLLPGMVLRVSLWKGSISLWKGISVSTCYFLCLGPVKLGSTGISNSSEFSEKLGVTLLGFNTNSEFSALSLSCFLPSHCCLTLPLTSAHLVEGGLCGSHVALALVIKIFRQNTDFSLSGPLPFLDFNLWETK